MPPRFVAIVIASLAGASWLQAEQTPAFHDEVVVTATLAGEEPRRDLAASAYVLAREEIEARQATTIAELIATVPGVQVVRLGAAGQQTSAFLRGSESDHVLVLWNGIPLNDPYFGGFNWAFLPADGVSRLEVVAGPFSALYGSSAAGGVVQVLTSAEPGVRARLEGGAKGYRRGAIAAARRHGSLAGELIGHARRGEGTLPNDDFAAEDLALRLSLDRERGQLGVLARYNDSATGIPHVAQAPSPERRIGWRELEVALPSQWSGDRWEAQALLSRVAYESAFRDPDDPFGFTFSDTSSRGERGRSAATWRPGGAFWWAGGAELERLTVSDRSSFGVNLDGARQRTWALFTELHVAGERWAAQLGVRRDDNDVFGEHVSPRGGAVLSVTPHLRLRASYGEGFRAPSLGELYFPFFGNADLLPERSASWEAGAEHQRGPWRLQVTGFESRLRDLIDFDEAFRSVNRGRARLRGVEAGGGFERGVFSARLAATWLQARDLEQGLPLRRRARRSGSLSGTWRPGAFTFNALASYVGERPDTHPVTGTLASNPGHHRLDLAAQWQARPAVAPYARIENVGGRRYQEALGFPAPGRTLVVGVAVTR
jgi:vitamin B12 transporter